MRLIQYRKAVEPLLKERVRRRLIARQQKVESGTKDNPSRTKKECIQKRGLSGRKNRVLER